MSARLPCAFVDHKKAFDSVYRNALWYKLLTCELMVTFCKYLDL